MLPDNFPVNRTKCLIALGVLIALAAFAPLRAASRAEDRDYARATNTFADRLWGPAEQKFGDFITTHTNSTRRPDAVLYMARARIEQSNYTGALQLLQPPPPGKLAPDYVFWTAKAYFGQGEYTNAIAHCAYMLLNLPADPPLRLSAAYLQAQARAKLLDWPGVIELLSRPDGAFQTAARADPDSKDAVNGFFLLGEAYLQERQYAKGEAAIRQLDPANLAPELKWQRQYLLCRILLDAGQAEEALTNSANLAALQATQVQRTDTAFLRGEILERLNQPAEALQEYTRNLADGLPPDVNRQALRKMIDLTQPPEAMQRLEDFIKQRPKDPILDLAWLYLGDLKLKAYFAPPPPGTNGAPPADTNLLQAAITNLDRVIQDFPNSQFRGKARLDLGWCDWKQDKFAEATTNFSLAVDLLPPSEDQAVALLKLADAQIQIGDQGAAVANYNRLLQDYGKMESVTNGLFDLALYHLVQANLKLGDENAANIAADHILNWYPASGFGERSLLLLGEDANQKTNYAKAREIFIKLLEKDPSTTLQPDIQFAIARTYEQEGNWTNALRAYDDWVVNTNFSNNALLPQVQFSRALASWKAGLETNALTRMSNIVSQFPNSSQAPLAQNWIGDYFNNHGDYAGADFAYQNLWKLFPNDALVYQARLMAGQAALHYDKPQASNDFFVLVNDTNTPAPIKNEAWFQLGYTDFQLFQDAHTNNALLDAAIAALSKVTNSSPSNTLAPQALGQLGNCWLAWALLQSDPAAKTTAFTNAIRMYQAELDLGPEANVTARGEAECGLGLVAKWLDKPDEELSHYLNVLEAGNSENPDPYWVKQAGVAAAQWCIDRGQWTNAITIYSRVEEAVPSLRAEMEKDKNIAKAKARTKSAAPGD